MKDLLIYAAQVVVCSGVFMLFYRTMLAGRASFLVGRLYLVAAMLLSLVIPALAIPIFPAHTVYVAPATVSVGNIVAVAAPAKTLTARSAVIMVYLSVAVFMLGVMAAGFVRIHRLRGGARRETFEGYSIYRSADVKSPFSFGRSVYVGDDLEEVEYRQIIGHELSHIRHHHPVEKTFMSLVRIAQWYNPFAWLSHRWLRELHEYEADSDVLASGCDMTDYQKLILKQVLGYNPDITCGLNNSLTKKRFIMMTRQKKSKGAFLRAVCGVLLVGGLVASFGFTRMPTRYVSQDNPSAVDVGSTLAGQPGKTPLFILDGTEVSESMVRALNKERIKAITILKDKEAKEKYGRKGKNGVMEITLLTADELAAKSKSLDEIIVVGYGNKNPLGADPMIIVDGVQISKSQMEAINPDAIESISVLKDKSATAKYGREAENGVVEITIRGNEVIAIIKKSGEQAVEDVSVVGAVAVDKGDKNKAMESIQTIDNPLVIIINGKKVSRSQMEAISPDDIESVSVLKDKTAVEQYGKEAENGVVIITLKKNVGRNTVLPKPAEDEKKTYDVVDEMPEFPGGERELLRWIASNIMYPEEARNSSIDGKVIIRFVVDEQGYVCEPKVLKTPSWLLSDEAKRLISESPRWTPGKKDGKAVRVNIVMPILFMMETNEAHSE